MDQKFDFYYKLIKAPIFCLSPQDSKVLYGNRETEELTGYPRTDMPEKTFFELLQSSDRKRVEAMLENLDIVPISQEKQVRMLRKSGRVVYVDLTAHKIDDSGQEVVVVSASDLTDPVRQKNTAMASKTYTERIIENLDQGVIISDDHFNVLYVNSFAKEIFGIEEPNELDIARMFNVERVADLLFQNEHIVEIDKADPCHILLRVSKVLSYDEKGEEYVFSFVDITDIKRAQATYVEANKMACLEDMAAAISHEVNNPLGIISGTVQQLLNMARSGKLEPEKLEMKSYKLVDNAQRIADIVNGLQSFSGMKTDDQALYINLRKALRAALAFSRHRISDQNIIVDDITIPENLEIFSNQGDLEQIILNLVKNAIDAIEKKEGGERIVRFAHKESSHYYELTIADNGDEIPDSISARMMEPFYTTKKNVPGAGLGLSVSVGLAKKIGGTLEYSRNDDWTCFTLQIPKDISFARKAS